METIAVNVNRELATQVSPVFGHFGIDIETALNVYMIQVIADKKPFSHQAKDVAEQTKYVRPPMQFDCLKGILDIDDDFSDVLADFEEYM